MSRINLGHVVGVEGSAVYYSRMSWSEFDDYIDKSFIRVPDGHSLKLRDLILDPSGHVFQIIDIEQLRVKVTYLFSIKGATGPQGPAGTWEGIVDSELSTTSTNPVENRAIGELVPSQASAQNQLADKNFVNSSIGTNTANYISNAGQPFTSLAQLQAYSGTVTNNDYAFVTGTDSAGNTYFDRYKATVNGSSVTWAKEYRLNNSSFTAAQWVAINSGITALLVQSYNAHLSATNNPHNVTKAQVGLGNVDNTSDINKPISTATQTALNNKVDKVTGKGLSTNDYTTTEKTKLAGIESGANKTTVDSSVSSTSTNPLQNKVVNSSFMRKFNPTTMEDLGFTAGSTVDVATFLEKIRTTYASRCVVDFGWAEAKGAKLTDGTNTTNTISGYTLFLGLNNVNTESGTWQCSGGLLVPVAGGKNTYVISCTISATAGTITNKTIVRLSNAGHEHSASEITTGTLPLARGGTSATTAKEAQYNLLSDCADYQQNVTDNSYFAFTDYSTTHSNGFLFKRKANYVWNWIKSKLATVATSGSYNDLTNKPTIPQAGSYSPEGKFLNISGSGTGSEVSAETFTSFEIDGYKHIKIFYLVNITNLSSHQKINFVCNYSPHVVEGVNLNKVIDAHVVSVVPPSGLQDEELFYEDISFRPYVDNITSLSLGQITVMNLSARNYANFNVRFVVELWEKL